MKSLLLNSLLAIYCMISSYLISGSKAQAEDWGCQVILCLSNPGGPTQYGECRPPIQKLWRELARGHSFPTCSGVGFHSSRPGYEPYYCDAGYRLTGDGGPRGRQVTCVSISPQPVSNALCPNNGDDFSARDNSVLSPHWQRQDGRRRCMGYPIVRPNMRPQPHYIDVTIDGSTTQRVWY
ncbi:hypothetical protein GGE45_001604 [Rhizobium aethiopicum]|uniref:Uncharacterized protein n=1 Tax=Rhizobium aethiopicum TaxID=1138170 RepID=A0A7W6MHW6_9HYPH|nr:hypothetical protein [Rhizobium aethiopicum]MBB4193019.1 hypothetical protein [Rhizobium aethiopicum]MBB4579280.1 hypothetical protein [Rhizobium aethiopicum]